MTPILHCNVNSHGKICHSIFDRNYNAGAGRCRAARPGEPCRGATTYRARPVCGLADTSMATILNCVYGLLLTPDKHDPVDSTLALSANNDSGEYEGSIMAHVALHAAKPREELVCRSPKTTLNSVFLRFLYDPRVLTGYSSEPLGIPIENRY